MNSSYNKYEKLIAGVLSRNPVFKTLLKRLYTRIVYPLNRKQYNHKTEFEIGSIRLDEKDTFFGYYDKASINTKGKIIFHAAPKVTHKKPYKVEQIDICISEVKDPSNPLFKTKSKAFNWQQGSRAHWLTDDLFIYNDFNEGEQNFQSVILSISDKSYKKKINKPVQDSYKDVYFLSINYSRLQALRPDYGYSNLPALNDEQLSQYDNDGISYCDIRTGQITLLYSLSEIMNFEWVDKFKDSIHWVNHVMISPDGDRFIFIHRFIYKKKLFSRLLCADIKSKNLDLISNNEMVSHCCWKDNETIFGFLRGPDNTDNYWFINLLSKVHTKYEPQGLKNVGDGHPGLLGDNLIFDTYPDKSRLQHLYLNEIKTGKTLKMGAFYTPFKYFKETRCDLHPRFSQCGKYITFDSTHEGKRRMYYIDLGKNLIAV